MSHLSMLFTFLDVWSTLMLCYMYSYFPAMLPLLLGSESSMLNILYSLVGIKYYFTDFQNLIRNRFSLGFNALAYVHG